MLGVRSLARWDLRATEAWIQPFHAWLVKQNWVRAVPLIFLYTIHTSHASTCVPRLLQCLHEFRPYIRQSFWIIGFGEFWYLSKNYTIIGFEYFLTHPEPVYDLKIQSIGSAIKIFSKIILLLKYNFYLPLFYSNHLGNVLFSIFFIFLWLFFKIVRNFKI